MGSKRFIPLIFYIKDLLIRNGNSNCPPQKKIAANRSLKQTEVLSRERISLDSILSLLMKSNKA